MLLIILISVFIYLSISHMLKKRRELEEKLDRINERLAEKERIERLRKVKNNKFTKTLMDKKPKKDE